MQQESIMSPFERLKLEVCRHAEESAALGRVGESCIDKLSEKNSRVIEQANELKGLMCKTTDEGVIVHQAYPGPHMYGNILWDSGRALAKFFAWGGARQVDPCTLCHKWVGKSILELGAGTGVVGLTLGQFGATVNLTDREPIVLELLKRNIAANALGAQVSSHRLDWGDSSTYLLHQSFDLVIAADVLYEGPQGQLLADVIEAHVPIESRTQVYLSYTYRPQAPFHFLATMLKMGFVVERLEDCKGWAVGSAFGQPAVVYDGTRFVELSDVIVLNAMKAESEAAGFHHIQIFRFFRPSAALCAYPPADQHHTADHVQMP